MPDDTASFLTKILPETGVYQLFVKDTRRHLTFSDPVAMAAKALSLDAKGVEVYHACASYLSGENRRADNVAAVKCVWLDVDCGTDKAEANKGYESKPDALIAIRAFCKLLGLPKPMIVDSGGGFHIYWPFVNTISPVEWKTATTKLKALYHAQKCRLLADDSRTTDIASILRPVGTHNRKTSSPRLVSLLLDAEPVAFEVFNGAIEAAHQRFVSGSRMVHAPGPAIRSGEDVRSQVNPDGYTLDEVEAALALISPWCPRPEWIKVGFALADAFSDEAFDLFLRWSRGDLEGLSK
jgi:hypothetical protein